MSEVSLQIIIVEQKSHIKSLEQRLNTETLRAQQEIFLLKHSLQQERERRVHIESQLTILITQQQHMIHHK